MSNANGGATTPDAEQRAGRLNARVVLTALRRRPMELLAVAVLAGGVGACVWFFLPLPKMTAATVFHISSRAPVLLAPTTDNQVDFNSYRQSQAALVKRRMTLNNVAKQREVQNLDVIRAQPDPVAWLDKSLLVDSRTGSEFMRVSIEGENAEELRIILEAVSKAYLAEVDERDHGMRRRRLAKLDDTYRQYKADLERFHKRMDTIAFALGSKDAATLAVLDSIAQEELRAAMRDLNTARQNVKLAELALQREGIPVPQFTAPEVQPDFALPWNLGNRRAATAPAGAVTPELVEAELDRDPEVLTLKEALDRAKVELKRWQDTTDNEALLAPYKAAVRDAEQRLSRGRDQIRPRIEANLRARTGTVPPQPTRAATLLATYDSAKHRELVALANVDRLQKDIAKANEYRVELDNIKLQIGQTERLSTRLADEIEQIKVELGAPSRVTHSEEPFVVPGIEGNRRLKYTLLAALAVLLAGVALVVVWEHRTRRLTHADDITTALGARLIGTVPTTSGDPTQAAQSHPVLVEAIDATRTMLLNCPSGADLRVLVVTSAVSAEGKTSLSGHLAISLARAGFRTLLIDGDVRAPSVQDVFQIAVVPGLCELLRNQASLAEAARPTGVPGLSVMPAGEWTLSTRQALVGDGWRHLTEQLKANFDFVVIDTSPLLLVSDTLLLAREADGVVMSVMMGVSQVSHVSDAIGRLHAIGAKFTGVIANGVRTTAQEYAVGYVRGSKKRPGSAATAPVAAGR